MHLAVKVHRFVPDAPGTRKGALACMPSAWMWREPRCDSEVTDFNGQRFETQGGINHKVTCLACLRATPLLTT